MQHLTIIESPFRGDMEANTAYARAAMLDSIGRGELPFASHLLYPQVLDDRRPAERALGMQLGQAYEIWAERMAVYVDHGITEGMAAAIARAKARGIPIVERTLSPATEKRAE